MSIIVRLLEVMLTLMYFIVLPSNILITSYLSRNDESI